MADELREEISVLTPHGDPETWSVVAVAEDSGEWRVEASDKNRRVWTGSGSDLFDAFRALRENPEAQGFRFLVVGARIDSWPTQMSRQMGGGAELVIRYRSPTLMLISNLLGYLRLRLPYRYIFSPAPASKVGTVAEQDAYQEEWLRRAVGFAERRP
ncbi:hypothetical protein GCM10023196_046060 [Actinoallomurus vinaceus]|uniref:Uncharacterized protein n=1 Tax=Actinoallomurus vinaceus TaxID=1080074 RepID=A0ABP8UC26_9ACTN